MAHILAPEIPGPGFSFENCSRNAKFNAAGYQATPVISTGTTIAGIVIRDGVILGADTRATEGTLVSDKNCEKIHYLAKNMYCCGAGTAADTEMTTQLIASQLELHRLNTGGRVVPVITANTLLKQMLFRYRGEIGAALVLGGVDNTGPHLHSIYPAGSTDKLPYVTMGSGSLAAMAVFELRWRPNMTEQAGKKLVRDAVAAGIFNDLASGSNIDLCVVRRDGVKRLRTYEEASLKGKLLNSYRYPSGTTAVLSTTVTPILNHDSRPRDQDMDTT